jgi:hypothetical protein
MPLTDVPGRVSRWTDYECAGGVPIGLVGVYDECEISDAIDEPQSYRLRVPVDIGRDIVTGEVHRVVDLTGVVREFRVAGVRIVEGASESDVYEFTGESPLMELADVGIIVDTLGLLPVFDAGAELTITQWVQYVCDWMDARGQTWWTPGTIESDEWMVLQFGATGVTPLEIVRALQADQGLELGLRRVGGTAFALDLVAELGAGAPRPVIRWGRNLRTRTRQTDIGERATAITIMGQVPTGAERGPTIADAVWTLTSIIGTAPAWLTLADVQGREGPLAFDGQLVDVGARLMRDDGVTVAITGSRIIDQAVEVASNTGFVVGQRVQFVLTATGKRLVELTAPNTRRIARTIAVDTVRGERNLVPNATWVEWVDDGTPVGGWTVVGTCLVARYRRPEASGDEGGTTVGVTALNATSIAIEGTTAGARFYGTEVLRSTIGSIPVTVTGTVHTADAFGAITLPITPCPASIPAGRVMQLATIYPFAPPNKTFGPVRPSNATMPDEPRVRTVAGFMLRFATTQSSTAWPPVVGHNQLRAPSVAVKVGGGTQQVNASVGFTITNGTALVRGNEYFDGSTWVHSNNPQLFADAVAIFPNYARKELPGVLLLDVTSTPTVLAHGMVWGLIPVGPVVYHETVEIAATLTADRTVTVGLLPGLTTMFQMVRWVNLWLGLSQGVPIYDGSWGTLLWQRANRELLARQHDGENIEVTYFDLSIAAGYDITTERLTLGGRLDLGDAGVYPRVVALRLDLVNPDNSRAVLDGRSTRMTRLLAERL